MKIGITLAVASVLYAASLAATAPAWILSDALAAATHGRVRLEGARGTVWHGHASALLVDENAGADYHYQQVNWRWIGSRALRGQLAIRLETNGPGLSGGAQLGIGPGGLRANEVRFRLPVSTLAAYRPLLAAAGLSGELTLRSHEFVMGAAGFAGSAVLEWREAASTLSRLQPLGDYTALLTGAGERLQFRIKTRSGALQLNAAGAWSEREGLSIEGTAKSDPDAASRMDDLLLRLGPEVGNGVHRLQFSAIQAQKRETH